MQRLAGATLLIFANKQDVAGALSVAEIRDVSHASDRNCSFLILTDPRQRDMPQALDLPSIKSHRWMIQPCSAVTGENLVEGLDWTVKDVASRCVVQTARQLD